MRCIYIGILIVHEFNRFSLSFSIYVCTYLYLAYSTVNFTMILDEGTSKKIMSSYPKSGSSNDRAAKRRKRRFQGNQFSTKSDDKEFNESSSARKLSTVSTNDIIVHFLHNYRIIKIFTVFNALTNVIICRSCKQSIQFADSGHRGLGFKIILSCVCGRREINSGPLMHTGFEINRRIVFTMRLFGIGREGLNLF